MVKYAKEVDNATKAAKVGGLDAGDMPGWQSLTMACQRPVNILQPRGSTAHDYSTVCMTPVRQH